MGCAVKQVASVLPTALTTAALQLHTQSFTTRGEATAKRCFQNGIATLYFTGRTLSYLH